MIGDRNTWVYDARQAVSELDNLGIARPANVSESLAVMQCVEAMQPVKPEQTALRAAFIAGAKQDEIDRMLMADIGYQRLNSEWNQAHINAAGSVLAAIRNSVDQLMPPLRERADAAIVKLQRVADLDGVKLDGLVRAGRTDDAKALADAGSVVAELTQLWNMRDNSLTRGGGVALNVNGANCSRWRDPEAAAVGARGKTAGDQYIAGLRAGCQLWFPSPTEAIAAATAVAAKRAAAAKLKASREHGVGSTAFMSA